VVERGDRSSNKRRDAMALALATQMTIEITEN
jgi:hypothetical protein